MEKLFFRLLSALLILVPASLFAFPSVFPTGTTIYKPDKSWSGYTVISNVAPGKHGKARAKRGVLLIDMNGNIVHSWKGVVGFPSKILPGGRLLASLKDKNSPGHDNDTMVQLDFSGNIEWKFNKLEKITHKTKDGKLRTTWSARQHHDFQREPNPVGYYAPGLDPYVDKGRTLVHSRCAGKNRSQRIYEVNWEGKIVWDWCASEYLDQIESKFGTFSGKRKARLAAAARANAKKGKSPGMSANRRTGKPSGAGAKGKPGKPRSLRPSWSTGNTASWLGPNKWYDAGDKRFHPDNVIANNLSDIMFIVSRKTGEIVWQIGPDYSKYPQLDKLGLNRRNFPDSASGGFSGGMQHHTHMIPKGLPGEGNILVFNNGLPYSIVMEFNPVTLKIVWQYSGIEIGYSESHSLAHSFFSSSISSVQRLPNGNTMITEGDGGRLFEVTPQHEIVWEYIFPVYDWPGLGWGQKVQPPKMTNAVYRAYRVPYEWVPQLEEPEELPVIPPENSSFNIEPESDGSLKMNQY